jgi:purine-binding chemotaxis protein CheW
LSTKTSVPTMPNNAVDQVRETVSDLAGKYLTFKLGSEVYGLEILKVREIMGLMPITAVPRTPSFVRGVINLRGKVIPVVDLRTKFGMESVEDTEETCIIVVDVGALGMGITVDAVSEVVEIAGCDIEDAPTFGKGVNTDFILGMGKANKKVTMLLDIRQVLTNEESMDLAAAASGADVKSDVVAQ